MPNILKYTFFYLSIKDYHVIAVHKTLTSSIVYDLDTKLDFPVDFKTYSEKSFPIKNKLKQYKP